jgi:hypothetical protein
LPPGQGLDRFGERQQQFLLRAGSVGLGFHDDLVLLIHRRHPRVALDDAFVAGHLGRLVVGPVRQPRLALGALAIVRMGFEPGPQLGRLGLEPLEPALRLAIARSFARVGVGRALLGQDLLDRLLHLVRLAQVVLPLPALGLGGIGGQLHPVDGEPLPTDQPLPIADREHPGEDLPNSRSQAAHELRQRAKAGRAVARDSHELHIGAAGRLHSPRTDDSTRVGQQYDLQEHPRVVGQGPFLLVLVACLDVLEIDLVIDQIVQGGLEAAGVQLLGQING